MLLSTHTNHVITYINRWGDQTIVMFRDEMLTDLAFEHTVKKESCGRQRLDLEYLPRVISSQLSGLSGCKIFENGGRKLKPKLLTKEGRFQHIP